MYLWNKTFGVMMRMANQMSRLQQGIAGCPSVIFWSFSIFSKIRGQWVKVLLQEVKTVFCLSVTLTNPGLLIQKIKS